METKLPYTISPVVKTCHPPLYQVLGPHGFESPWVEDTKAMVWLAMLNLPHKQLAEARERIAELEAEKGGGNG